MAPDQKEIGETIGALSGAMLAASFVTEPETWPAFVAHVERTLGRDFGATREAMERAIVILDSVRSGMAKAIGRDPGIPYPGRSDG